jgi:hypothetical protein
MPPTLLLVVALLAQGSPVNQSASPLPGKGLAQHPFLYCGTSDTRKPGETIYIVRGGTVTWSYTLPDEQELGDCWMLSNGHIVFSRKTGASEITLDKKIVWNYEAPQGTEIHTAQPIGLDRVLIMQNGDPARAMVIEKSNGRVRQQLVLQTRRPDNPRGQFRHIRLTNAGTFLVAHMDLDRVAEYDTSGTEIWSVAAPAARAAVRLTNGNTLISGNQHGYVREVNKNGELVWEINKNDLPGITLHTVHAVSRLANGNTLINNSPGTRPQGEWRSVVQLVEVTPAKRVVWALRDWETLGPASSTQLLDETGVAERGQLQR